MDGVRRRLDQTRSHWLELLNMTGKPTVSSIHGVRTEILPAFDQPPVNAKMWSALLKTGETNELSLTWQSLRLWWDANRQNRTLALITALRGGTPVAIAPLFIESGMAMNLCPVQAVDFVGDISDPEILDALLRAARENVPDFVGFRFYHVPHTSTTAARLRRAATRFGLDCFLEDEQPCPFIDIKGKAEAARACTQKKTPLRRERQLRRLGHLQVRHFRETEEVLEQLEDYFRLHVDRWKETPTPSKFRTAEARERFRERTRSLGPQGWLRFSRLELDGEPIALDWGTCYQGRYKYGKPAHAAHLERYSPGAVLLRHVLLAAIEEGAHTFDFGFGGEDYKSRYATDIVRLQTWGLYTKREGAR